MFRISFIIIILSFKNYCNAFDSNYISKPGRRCYTEEKGMVMPAGLEYKSYSNPMDTCETTNNYCIKLTMHSGKKEITSRNTSLLRDSTLRGCTTTHLDKLCAYLPYTCNSLDSIKVGQVEYVGHMQLCCCQQDYCNHSNITNTSAALILSLLFGLYKLLSY